MHTSYIRHTHTHTSILVAQDPGGSEQSLCEGPYTSQSAADQWYTRITSTGTDNASYNATPQSI